MLFRSLPGRPSLRPPGTAVKVAGPQLLQPKEYRTGTHRNQVLTGTNHRITSPNNLRPPRPTHDISYVPAANRYRTAREAGSAAVTHRHKAGFLIRSVTHLTVWGCCDVRCNRKGRYLSCFAGLENSLDASMITFRNCHPSLEDARRNASFSAGCNYPECTHKRPAYRFKNR